MTTKKKSSPKKTPLAVLISPVRKTPDELCRELIKLIGKPEDEIRRGLHKAFRKTAGEIRRELDEYRAWADKGHFMAFLCALDLCGKNGFPLPGWMAERIGKASAAYSEHHAATLDEAFGASRPRYYHQSTAREDATESFPLYLRCEELRKEGVATDAELFERVKKEFRARFTDLSASKVRDHYYHWKKIFGDDKPGKRRGRPPGKKAGGIKPKE